MQRMTDLATGPSDLQAPASAKPKLAPDAVGGGTFGTIREQFPRISKHAAGRDQESRAIMQPQSNAIYRDSNKRALCRFAHKRRT